MKKVKLFKKGGCTLHIPADCRVWKHSWLNLCKKSLLTTVDNTVVYTKVPLEDLLEAYLNIPPPSEHRGHHDFNELEQTKESLETVRSSLRLSLHKLNFNGFELLAERLAKLHDQLQPVSDYLEKCSNMGAK